MGEAKRRKQLDPDFGMPNGLKFLTREAEPTKAELKVIFDEFVPREVERAAFMFSFEASGNGYSLTPALQALVNDQKLDFDAAMLLRNGTTIDWVKAFIRESIAKHQRFAGLEERIQARLATAIDGLSNLYPIDELEPATPDSFKTPRQFILKDGAVVRIGRTANGLSINGIERVRIPDEIDIACQNLAQMFDGAIVKDVNLAQFGIVEDTSDDDW